MCEGRRHDQAPGTTARRRAHRDIPRPEARLSVREAARRAGISEGWWRQVVKGYQSLSGGGVGLKLRPKVLLPPEEIPVELRIEQLLARLSETEALGFEDLFSDVEERRGMIVTFLALLEMIRLKLVRVFQSGSFGPIRVYKRARPADAPHPIGDPEDNRG